MSLDIETAAGRTTKEGNARMPVTAKDRLQEFVVSVPTRTRCADVLADGLTYRSVAEALQHQHIQLNTSGRISWLAFDVDRPDAKFAARDGVLPPETVNVRNPSNGHAHLLYRLALPVPTTDASRVKPVQFLAAVQRGMVRRLDADPGYCGLIVKNPAHYRWDTAWGRREPYTLEELGDWLHRENMRRTSRRDDEAGFGRNCTVFSELRRFAYSEVRRFKREGSSPVEFKKRLEDVALGLNMQFPEALPLSEIRAIVQSVSKWVWVRFSAEQFHAIQSWRGEQLGMKRRAEAQKREARARCLLAEIFDHVGVEAHLSDMARDQNCLTGGNND